VQARHRRRGKHTLSGTVVGTALAASLAYTATAEEELDDTTGEIPVVQPFADEYMVELDEARKDAAAVARSLPARPALIPKPEPPKDPKPPPEVLTTEPEPEPEPAPEPAPEGLSSAREGVIAFARAQIGEPYVYGDEGPDSWDCSGLTQAAFASVGISIPRVSSDQHNIGEQVPISDLSPGDLVGWDGHVALYSGEGNIIEAARPGTNVRERPLADHWFDQGAWGIRLDYSTL
jgi:cell wall-associated NlpC family hydrolase